MNKMADTELRANSLRIRFERGVPEPTDHEIFKFMKSKMGLSSEKLLSMYKDKSEMSVIVKFKREEDMRNTLSDLPGTMVFEYNKYESTEVKLSSANAIVRYIRLFNLPPEIEDREISLVMQRFGKIVRMVREKYGEETGFPIWTSVRGVYLEIKEGIEVPASVFIRNVRARVFYEGIVNKCYLCGSTDHLKAECPEKKSVNDRMRDQQVASYSGILKSGERWLKQQQTKSSNSEKDGMIRLGQGPPKRSNTAKAQSGQDSHNGEAATQHSENSGIGEDETTTGNQMEHAVDAAAEHEEECSGGVDSNVDVDMGDNGFIKVTGKRGRKHQKSTEKEGTSDSDESPSERVHRERKEQSGTKVGTLSETLDRITRSKSKQRKLSDREVITAAGGEPVVTEVARVDISERK